MKEEKQTVEAKPPEPIKKFKYFKKKSLTDQDKELIVLLQKTKIGCIIEHFPKVIKVTWYEEPKRNFPFF